MIFNNKNRFSSTMCRWLLTGVAVLGVLVSVEAVAAVGAADTGQALAGGVFIPISRSELVVVQKDIAEIIVADPSIADVHVIGSKRVALIGKKIGRTNARLFDKSNNVIRQFDIIVGYDLPAIRKALHFFLPNEKVYVNLVNANVALTGEVSDASVVDKVMRIVNQFVSSDANPSFSGGVAGGGSSSGASSSGASGGGSSDSSSSGSGSGGSSAGASGSGGSGSSSTTKGTYTSAPTYTSSADTTSVLNLLKVTSGQQVMLRVKVGEVKREAMKNLGISLSTLANGANILGGTQNKVSVFDTGSGSTQYPALGVNGLVRSTTESGFLMGTLTSGGFALSAAIEALETEGLFKVLAQPDLVAMSGEKAEFLAGGQFPILVPQTGGSTSSSAVNTVQYQPYGVSVQFIPTVLAQSRIRIAVQPEVSEIDSSLSTSTVAPSLLTRRAKTTVELAPGESFMIAGLMSDNLSSTINEIPGAASIPILGALLRSTTYQRQETELVISVTPYLVDPVKSSDIRSPTDDFRPASIMEQFFYGALGSTSGNEYKQAQMPSLEGPIGFVTD